MKDVDNKGICKNTFDDLVATYERELIVDALKDARGNQTKAAQILGATKRIIRYKIMKYGINFRRLRGTTS
jgi:Nif-specific regulatory protein